jgi:hypothetical protein
MVSDGGKGSKQRPTDEQKYHEGWDRIFGGKKKEKENK